LIQFDHLERGCPRAHRLPSAHTCFNHLLLPEYEGKEQLEERFRTAIQECSGFHIV